MAETLLPDDVILETLAKLPVKSLFRFKCVSKTWYSMISNKLCILEIFAKLPQKSLLRFKSVCKSWHSMIEDLKLDERQFHEIVVEGFEEGDRGSLVQAAFAYYAEMKRLEYVGKKLIMWGYMDPRDVVEAMKGVKESLVITVRRIAKEEIPVDPETEDEEETEDDDDEETEHDDHEEIEDDAEV